MNLKVKKYLFDIEEAITSIESYLGKQRNYHDYLKNKMLRRAVEREFEIIGEAMSRILKIEPNIAITDKRRIVDMRNRVIHGYDKVDNEIIWGTIVRHLPMLKKDVSFLLRE